jgi:hypothetical protein
LGFTLTSVSVNSSHFVSFWNTLSLHIFFFPEMY